MDVIGARIARDYPDSNKGWGVTVERYSDVIIGPDMRTALYVLLSATGMVLLIGCANLANLALARGVARDREVAIRSSLGAGRWRLVRQFLTENVLLAVCGGVLGVAIGFGTMKYLNFLVPPNTLPREADVSMDSRVLLFALGISVLTGLLFGMAPALQATTPELANSMKEGGRGATTGTARRHLSDVLVIAEVSLAFVLLAGSGLMIRSFFRLINVDTGFDSTNVLTMTLRISDQSYPDPAQLNAYLREIQTAVEAVPGVRETALTCAPPLEGACYGMPSRWRAAPSSIARIGKLDSTRWSARPIFTRSGSSCSKAALSAITTGKDRSPPSSSMTVWRSDTSRTRIPSVNASSFSRLFLERPSWAPKSPGRLSA